MSFCHLLLAMVLLLALPGGLMLAQEPGGGPLKSPDGKLEVGFRVDDTGVPRYRVRLEGKPALQESRLGLVREDGDFSKGMRLVGQSGPEAVEDHYEILTAKRRVNVYQANRVVFHLVGEGGEKLDVIFQVSNDGVAFRYVFPEQSGDVKKLKEEASSFHFLPGTLAWLQPMSVAKSGWQATNPSYEEYYQKGIAVGTPSTLGAGWVYPALFQTGDTWVLLSEAGVGRNYCGTRLRSESPDGEYSVGFPDAKENYLGGAVNPESTLPWETPWRIIVVGSLKTVAESMLGVDVATKPTVAVDVAAAPGKASWSWPLMGDKNTTFEVQKKFVDYAAEMEWKYCLVDALWDTQIGYEKMKELADYAAGKRVKVLVWYNSAGNWNTSPQTPRDKMVTHESRMAEFAKLKEMGIAGVKVDFFGGDGQSMMGYYQEILEDAAGFGLLVNFHGATLPRGWQRTYPHLMTMEAIRGFEFITFEQANADQEPAHATMLPFTRNVFDPMDFTPVCLDKINDRVHRKTTSGFELALSVIFTSGIQHYAEIPEGMAKMPEYLREYIRKVPSVWDESKFLDGFPGKFVVMARQGEGRWYVAGINGEAQEKKVTVDLSELKAKGAGLLITDGGGEALFERREVSVPENGKLEVTMKANGGFVAVFQ